MKSARLIAVAFAFAVAPFTSLANGPKSPPYTRPGYVPNWELSLSPAVTVRNRALIHTGQIYPSGKWLDPMIDGCGVTEGQINGALNQLDAVLKEGGSSLVESVKLNVYVPNEIYAEAAAYEIQNRFDGWPLPAVSFVATQLPVPHARIAFDAVAPTKQPSHEVRRWMSTAQSSTGRPILEGKTSGAILPAGPRVYISGQAEKGTLLTATRKTMAELMKTLEHLGLSSRDVVQLKAFVTSIKAAPVVMKEIAAAFPGETSPPIILVEWQSSLPIEIELIAASPVPKEPQDAPPLEFITPPWMKASPVFCRVVRVNHPATIFISGLYGATDSPDSVEEVRDLYGSLRRIAEASGSDLKHLAKATYYVSTDEVSNQLNVVRPEFYDPERPPSASKAKVRGTGRTGRTITLDMIAVPTGP